MKSVIVCAGKQRRWMYVKATEEPESVFRDTRRNKGRMKKRRM